MSVLVSGVGARRSQVGMRQSGVGAAVLAMRQVLEDRPSNTVERTVRTGAARLDSVEYWVAAVAASLAGRSVLRVAAATVVAVVAEAAAAVVAVAAELAAAAVAIATAAVVVAGGPTGWLP